MTIENKAAHRRGLMFVLSAPSGAGKTTLARLLLQCDPELELSVSWTTRAPRPGETDGKDYVFAAPDEFERRAREGFFFEHAEVFGNRYGTPKDPAERRISEGGDVLFDVDWQGAKTLSAAVRGDVASVFILPPSLRELRRRLEARGQDSAEVIHGRMARAADEISHWDQYDYVIVNDDIDAALQNVRVILASERLKRERQTALTETVKCLLSEHRHN